MESGLSIIKQHMTTLNIPAAAGILDELLLEAQSKDFTHQEFLYQLVAHGDHHPGKAPFGKTA